MGEDEKKETLPFDLTIDTDITTHGDTDTTQPDELGTITAPDSAIEFRELSERYNLIQELASGASGTVWLAKDRLLNRDVAVKILREKHLQSAEACRRFVAEARLTGRLAHPGVIPVHDLGQMSDSRWFFVMQRIQGSDLKTRFDDLRAGDPETLNAFTLPRLLSLFGRVCMTVAYAHDRGYIHRDLKPGNIMVGEFDEMFVADWGLAKSFNRELLERSMLDTGDETDTGTLVGTIRYMSPEQIKGEVKTLTPKTDVFSLGVILYECLTLDTPFKASSLYKMMMKIIAGDSQIPDIGFDGSPIALPLKELITAALNTDPDLRPTAVELANRINRYLDGVEEKRKARERAITSLNAGQAMCENYRKQRALLAKHKASLRHAQENLDNALQSGDHVRNKTVSPEQLELWRSSQKIDDLADETERLFTSAVRSLEQSLQDEDNRPAHTLLASLYWDKYAEAKKTSDDQTALYFRSLVQEHDTGAYADALSNMGSIEINCTQKDAHTSVERFRKTGPLLTREPVTEPLNALPVGSYLVTVSALDRMSARIPVMVSGNHKSRLDVDLPAAFGGHDEFVFIPGGRALLGDPDAPAGVEGRECEVSAFLIGRFPVTVEQYAEFLNDIAGRDTEVALSHSPRSPNGTVFLPFDRQLKRFLVGVADVDGDIWDPRWPATMLNYNDAQAYCTWRSQRDGVTYRLPTEDEWEYAARGVDRRIYPWGTDFSSSIACAERGGTKDGLSTVDSFPYDESPFGVRQMGGMAIEWTSTRSVDDRLIMKGGGLFSTPPWCRAGSRKFQLPEWLGVQFGFRLVRDLA